MLSNIFSILLLSTVMTSGRLMSNRGYASTNCQDLVFCHLILGDIADITNTTSEFNFTYYRTVAEAYSLIYLDNAFGHVLTSAVLVNESVSKTHPFGTNKTKFENIRRNLMQFGIEFLPRNESEWRQLDSTNASITKRLKNVCGKMLDSCVGTVTSYDLNCNWKTYPRTKFNCTTIAKWPSNITMYLQQSQKLCRYISSSCSIPNNDPEPRDVIGTVAKPFSDVIGAGSSLFGNFFGDGLGLGHGSKKLGTINILPPEGSRPSNTAINEACLRDVGHENLTSTRSIEVKYFGDYGVGCGTIVSDWINSNDIGAGKNVVIRGSRWKDDYVEDWVGCPRYAYVSKIIPHQPTSGDQFSAIFSLGHAEGIYDISIECTQQIYLGRPESRKLDPEDRTASQQTINEISTADTFIPIIEQGTGVVTEVLKPVDTTNGILRGKVSRAAGGARNVIDDASAIAQEVAKPVTDTVNKATKITNQVVHSGSELVIEGLDAFTGGAASDITKTVNKFLNQEEVTKNCTGYITRVSFDAPDSEPSHLRKLTSYCHEVNHSKVIGNNPPPVLSISTITDPLNYESNFGSAEWKDAAEHAGSGGLLTCPGQRAICAVRTHIASAEFSKDLMWFLIDLGADTLSSAIATATAGTAAATPPFTASPPALLSVAATALTIFSIVRKISSVKAMIISGNYVHGMQIACCNLEYKCKVHALYVVTVEIKAGQFEGTQDKGINISLGRESADFGFPPYERVLSNRITYFVPFILAGARKHIKQWALDNKELLGPTHPKLVSLYTCDNDAVEPDPVDPANRDHEFRTLLTDYDRPYTFMENAIKKTISAAMTTRFYQRIVLCGMTRTYLKMKEPIQVEFIDPGHCTGSIDWLFVKATLTNGIKVTYNLTLGTSYTSPKEMFLSGPPFIDHPEVVCNLTFARDHLNFQNDTELIGRKKEVFGLVKNLSVEAPFGDKINGPSLIFQQIMRCPSHLKSSEEYVTYTPKLMILPIPDINCNPTEHLVLPWFDEANSENVIENFQGSEPLAYAYGIYYGLEWEDISRTEPRLKIPTDFKSKELHDAIKIIKAKLRALNSPNYDWDKFEPVIADTTRVFMPNIRAEIGQKVIFYQVVAKCGNLVLRTKKIQKSIVDTKGVCLNDGGNIIATLKVSSTAFIVDKCQQPLLEIPKIREDCALVDYYTDIPNLYEKNLQPGTPEHDFSFNVSYGITWHNRDENKDFAQEFIDQDIASRLLAIVKRNGKSKNTHFDWSTVSDGSFKLLRKETPFYNTVRIKPGLVYTAYQIIIYCDPFFVRLANSDNQVDSPINGCSDESTGGWSCSERAGTWRPKVALKN